MALDLITGHQGVAHISAEQISTINKAMMDGYGDNKVMRMKNGTLTQDGLIIEVATGYWRANGFDIEIQEAETVYIDPSSIGMSRIDNVYVELLQDIPTGAQRAEIVTIQGEEAASDPTAPDAPTSPYLNTDILLDVIPLASVTVTEGVMVLTDLTEDFDLVTPSELAAVEGEALAAQSAASTAQTAADNAQQAIAPIEASSTASQAYAIGEQFILNGLLTEATAAISQGDTIVVGNAGNAKLSDSVTDQLSTLKDALNDVKTNKSNLLVRESASKTVSIAASPTNFSLSLNKAGYTPILYDIHWGQSANIIAQVEGVSFSNGSFTCTGYGKSTGGTMNVPFTVDVLWVKNS